MDTPVTFACEGCGASITFPAARRGHVETCPHCGEYVDVPARPSPDASPAEPEPAEKDPPINAGPSWPSDRYLWLEVFAVLCLIVFPSLFAAVEAIMVPTPARSPFSYHELFLTVTSFEISVPLLVIAMLTKEPWHRFGIVRFSLFADPAFGVAIWICVLVAKFSAISLVPPSVLTLIPSTAAERLRPPGYASGLLLLVACLAIGFTEEFAMRGYLLTRLERLLRSKWLAIVVTAIVFGSCHVYHGATGVISATAAGLVYGVAFCLQRRLWPVCIAHALVDFLVGMCS